MRNISPTPFLSTLLIAGSGSAFPSGAQLGHIVAEIARRELQEGGPYAIEPDSIEAPDLGFNLAIAVFLDQSDVRLPGLDAFINDYLSGNAHTSQYVEHAELSELVARYQAMRSTEDMSALVNTPLHTEARAQEKLIRSLIGDFFERRFALLSSEFASMSRSIMRRTMDGNPDKQMSLMPLFMRSALGEQGNVFSDEYVAESGLANIFFWTAFIIYDDFWDEDEAARPALLPVANLFARHYVRFFETLLPKESGFPAFFHSIMDSLDAANEWELLSCRLVLNGDIVEIPETLADYGDFGIKFYPAAGHVLAPVAMLIQLGHTIDSDEVRNLIEYFKHYLIAMQLNDDAHDWKEDLARGTYSTAVSYLLAAWKAEHPESNSIDLVEDMQELERIFWFTVLGPLSRATLEHTNASREALMAMNSIRDFAPLEQFITHNERVARQALTELETSNDFLEALSTAR